MVSVHAWPPKGADLCSSPAARRGVLASAPEATAGFGFPREARLTRPVDYTRVFRQGRRAHARYFTLIVTPGGSQHPRLGMAVGRRCSPLAVNRNRIKRMIRDEFRHTTMPPLDIVVVAKQGSGRVNSHVLRSDLKSLLDGLKA